MDQQVTFVGLSSMPFDQRVVACFRIDNTMVFQGKEAVSETVKSMPEKAAYKQAIYVLNTMVPKDLDVFPEVTDVLTLLNTVESRDDAEH